MIITEELKGTSEEDKRLMAERLESENPLWIIVYGVYTRQFVAFPRFKVPRQTIIATTYPPALPGRLREIERQAARALDEKFQPRHGK